MRKKVSGFIKYSHVYVFINAIISSSFRLVSKIASNWEDIEQLLTIILWCNHLCCRCRYFCLWIKILSGSVIIIVSTWLTFQTTFPVLSISVFFVLGYKTDSKLPQVSEIIFNLTLHESLWFQQRPTSWLVTSSIIPVPFLASL